MYYPLVSIIVPNYNYGRYLPKCLDSILNQTYPNIEVIFRDNASEDDSYEIALGYRKKFEEKGLYFFTARNKRNEGAGKNVALCNEETEGAYIMYLSSDDAIKPKFVERCVDIFMKYPNVGMVMVHREEMDEYGNIEQIPPFYNKNCIISGEAQAAVFMMAGVAVPSQVMVTEQARDKMLDKPFILQVANDWLDNFIVACNYDVAYIKDVLCQYRVHTGNETSGSEESLVGIFEHYELINSFVWISKSYGYTQPAKRYDEAVRKLGDMCLRYAVKMLRAKKNEIAQRYLLLAPVFKKEITENEMYKELWECMEKEYCEVLKRLERLEEKYPSKRLHSYEPPEGYCEIE